LNYNPSRIVLHSLQLVDRRGWGTMQQSIAVVDSGYSQLLCELLGKYFLVSELHNADIVRQVFFDYNF